MFIVRIYKKKAYNPFEEYKKKTNYKFDIQGKKITNLASIFNMNAVNLQVRFTIVLEGFIKCFDYWWHIHAKFRRAFPYSTEENSACYVLKKQTSENRQTRITCTIHSHLLFTAIIDKSCLSHINNEGELFNCFSINQMVDQIVNKLRYTFQLNYNNIQ